MITIDNYFLQVGVPRDELEDCYRWAFGIDYENILIMDFGDKWRELHGDLFMVQDSSLVCEVFPKIGKAYLEQKVKV